ncbi:hypothetical protein H5410_021026 [Solanum commersonii]|uniref:Uncharacterized protein n=1 Tax=Solanum commersonii TaxID=4109 RepID=A0A9J5ZA61_SOLCO|nr:hypothetical protein H5410_021026 [Solanum commersonii]
MYMEEVKRDLIKNLDIDIGDDISMASASHTNNDDEECIAGEAQSDHSNEEIDIDALLAKTNLYTKTLKAKFNYIQSEAIAMYMEEVKRDTIRNLDIDIGDDISMASMSYTNNDDEECIAGEAQSDHSNEEIDIDALFAKFQEQVEESSSKATY